MNPNNFLPGEALMRLPSDLISEGSILRNMVPVEICQENSHLKKDFKNKFFRISISKKYYFAFL
jgi:hypothetical protein